MLTVIEIWEFTKAHWPQLCAILAAFFAFTTWNGCAHNAELQAKLAACESKPPQVVTVAAKASQRVQVVYRDGSPCPDVTASNDTEATAVVAQAQTTPCPVPPAFGVGMNAGWLDGPYIGPSLDYKWLGVDGKWSAKAIGGGIRVSVRF